jgi:hypothetical protein
MYRRSWERFCVTQGSKTSDSSNVYEYAHGGTAPIVVLNDPGYAVGCAVDSRTGNLAVGNINDAYNPYYPDRGDVAVYTEAQGNPTMYYTSVFAGFGFCGYSGNLYLEGEALSTEKTELARLASGASTLDLVNVNKPVYASADVLPSVQWDGYHMTITTKNPTKGPTLVYRLKISKGKAKVVSTTKLNSKNNTHGGQTWIDGNAIVGVTYSGRYGDVSFWRYPKGGRPTATIRKIAQLNRSQLWGLAISPAQRH